MNILNGIILANTGPSLAIPGPYWLFTLLHWLTFALHLIAMNLLFGGLIILLISKNSPFRKLMFDTEIRLFPTVMAATITLGVAPLLFTQVIYGKFFYTATILSSWQWFLIIPVLLITYYLLYLVAMKKNISLSIKTNILWLALIGLIFISFTYTALSDLAEKPELWNNLYKAAPGGTSLNPDWMQIFFRWAHMAVGAMAVAGIGILIFSLYFPKVKDNPDLQRFGARIYLLGVIKAALFGLIYLFTIDTKILMEFLGSPGLHALLAGIIVNIGALIVLFKGLKNKTKTRQAILWGSGLVLGGLFCMVSARHYLRLIYLDKYFAPDKLTIGSQYSPLIMFLITFVIGLGVLWWMLKKYFKSPAA